MLKVNELKEADYREISEIIYKRDGKRYSPWTIRKVCKGERKNVVILSTAKNYIQKKEQIHSELSNATN